MQRIVGAMAAGLASMLVAAGCASGENDAEVAAFEQQLIVQYEIPRDDIVTAYKPGGIPKANLLLEHETCQVQLAGYEDSSDDTDEDLEVYILEVGLWSPPGNGALKLRKDDASLHLAELCAVYSPSAWTEAA